VRDAQCKRCSQSIQYSPRTNFILFCPKCRKSVLTECEYGYGPVTPCGILLGGEEIGVVEKKGYLYILKTQNETIALDKEYLEALHEACDIMERRLGDSEG